MSLDINITRLSEAKAEVERVMHYPLAHPTLNSAQQSFSRQNPKGREEVNNGIGE